MYSSMNLQAMYTGVISKYIQNSSLKVFEEVLGFFFFKKKALFLQQTIKKEVLYLWRDSRLKVEGCFFSFLIFFTFEVLTTHEGEGREKQSWWYSNSHLPLEEEQGCPAIPNQALTPDPWPATPLDKTWSDNDLWANEEVALGSGPRLLPQNSSSISIVLNIDHFFSLKYVYTHTWLQRISDHNIITKETKKKRKRKT